MHVINRDPFARADLVKDGPLSRSCSWCGNTDGHNNTYIYRWRSDGQLGSVHPILTPSPAFCSKSCWKAYTS